MNNNHPSLKEWLAINKGKNLNDYYKIYPASSNTEATKLYSWEQQEVNAKKIIPTTL